MSQYPQTLPLSLPPQATGETAGSLEARTVKPGLLVVDDDKMLLNLVSMILQRHGFTVWTACGGMEAVEVYRKLQRHIGVVLLDVRMPLLDGPETLAQLRRINPALRCCFMSGDTGDYSPDELLTRGASHCFDKPFCLDDMVRTLRRLALAA